MTALVAAARRRAPRSVEGALPLIAGVAIAVAVGAAVARHAGIHGVLACVIVVNITGFALRSPKQAIVLTLAFLPFLAFTRRLLLLYDGWLGADPLLLVGPAVAVVLLVGRNGAWRPRTALSTCVVALLVWTALSSLNPLAGSLRANAVGLLFVAAPLLWFFVGRDVADRATIRAVLLVEVCVGAVVALYGLAQTYGHWGSWDTRWLGVAGYQALYVGDSVRAFATFSSSAEYVSTLAVAMVIAVAFILYRGLHWSLLLPVLAVAAFLDGSRGIIVLTAGAAIVQIGLRTRRPALAAAVVVAGVGMVVGGVSVYKSAIQSSASTSNSALVQHQVSGLTHPLNSKKSTLPAHWRLFVNGFRGSFAEPLGRGPGATNLAGSRFGANIAPTEVDLSNAFVGLGLPGGLLFLAVVLLVWRHVLTLYRLRSDVVVLAAAGMLFVLLGQWLNGGYYALSPLVWLVAGWLEGEVASERARHVV